MNLTGVRFWILLAQSSPICTLALMRRGIGGFQGRYLLKRFSLSHPKKEYLFLRTLSSTPSVAGQAAVAIAARSQRRPALGGMALGTWLYPSLTESFRVCGSQLSVIARLSV